MADKNSSHRTSQSSQAAVVGPYRVDEALASGASGRVFRATGPNGDSVALKVFEASLRTKNTESRFRKEASIRIEHPNIVRVLDAGVDAKDTPYIALELLRGRTLTKRIRKKECLSVREVVDLGIQVCRGLEAAHAKGVIHRDLKPENLFCCDEGTVKILDFGIALWEEAPERITTTGIVIGTPWYLSPEQARGERTIDARADLWSLGVVLYEALSGTTPFERRGGLATVLAILQEEFAPLSRSAPQTPAPLATIVERCLVKDRRYRWSSAAALRQALEEVDLDAAPARLTAEQSLTSIAPGEQRVVAVLLAEGTVDSDRIEAVVRNYRGTYLPLYGKRAVGLFGGASWEGDEITRAALAALELRLAAARLAFVAGHATSHGASISGDALMAAEEGARVAGLERGSQETTDGTDPTGARESDVVPKGVSAEGRANIMVDARTGRLLEEGFKLAPSRAGHVELIDRRDTDMPAAYYPGGLSIAPAQPLFDREEPLGQVRQALRTVLLERTPQALLVTGPTGIGKTRLREEAERLLVASSPSVSLLLGRADTLGQARGYAVIAQALERRARQLYEERHLDSVEEDSEETTATDLLFVEGGDALRAAAIRELVRKSVPNEGLHQETAAFLSELLGIQQADSQLLYAARSDPRLMADRIRMALLDTLLGIAEQGPLGIFVEDVHWADKDSAKLLRELRERGPGLPVFVLATARPEDGEDEESPSARSTDRGPTGLPPRGEASPWSGDDVQTIALRPLKTKSAVALAKHAAGDQLSKRHVDEIVQRCGGNPLFIEQMVFEVRERAAPSGAAGAADAATPEAEDALTPLPLPLTVEAAVQSRLDRLPLLEKDACKRAAVFQRPFSVEELVHVGVADAQSILDSLVLRSIMVPRSTSRVGASREYRFRVQVFSDVAYGLLAGDARSALHRRAAEALEDLALSGAEEVAHHYERGGEQRLAAKRYAEATRDAANRGDGVAVLRCSDKAFALAVDKRDHFDLHVARADALQFMGRFHEQEECLEGAMAHAISARQKARVLSERIGCYWRTGRSDASLAAAEEAFEKAHLSNDADLIVMTAARRANVLAFVGKLDEAAETLTVASLEKEASARTQAHLAAARATVSSLQGELDERLHWNLEAARLHSISGDLRRGAVADGNVADSLSRLGLFEEAIASLERACERATRVNEPITLGFAYLNLSHAFSESVRFEEAKHAIAEASRIAARTGNKNLELLTNLYRAKVALRAGDLGLAATVAEEAADSAHAAGRKNEEAKARTTLAQARLGQHELEAGLVQSQAAVEILKELGSLDEDESETYLVHASLLSGLGRTEAAREAASSGWERIQVLANRIRDVAKRDAFLRSVSSNRALMELAEELSDQSSQ